MPRRTGTVCSTTRLAAPSNNTTFSECPTLETLAIAGAGPPEQVVFPRVYVSFAEEERGPRARAGLSAVSGRAARAAALLLLLPGAALSYLTLLLPPV